MESAMKDDRRMKEKAMKLNVGMDHDFGGAESTELIKFLADKWVAKMKEAKKECDEYFRFTKALHTAMDTIFDKTGVTNYNEFVSSFISSFEESQKLTNYILRLNDAIDELETDINNMESILAEDEKTTKMSEEQRNAILESI
jgi:hypothetical protein